MSNTEMQEGNKLIAEFMGLEPFENPYRNIEKEDGFYLRNNSDGTMDVVGTLKYHSSWNWFMPAWEKFRKCIDITGNPTEKYYQQYSQHCQQIATAIAHITIEESFARLVKAIQWYNQNKKP